MLLVQVVSLETACIDYLCLQAQQMTGDALICLAKLADHLGLSSLLETATEALSKLPWEKNMLHLNELLQMSLNKRETDRRDKLLHHPKRGAYIELQILELLKAANTPWSDCASAVDVESLQPSELHALLGVFADEKWDSYSEALLRPALKEQMRPEALRSKLDWTKLVRIVHIMLPEQQGSDSSVQKIVLPKCDLKLHITPEHKEGMASIKFYHLDILLHLTQSSACVSLSTTPRVTMYNVLLLCRSGNGWPLPASPLKHPKSPRECGASVHTLLCAHKSPICQIL